MTCSRSKPIAIISLTAFCRAEPVTNDGSLETAPVGAAGAAADDSVEGLAGVAGAAAGAAASVAGAGVEGAAGLSAGAAAGADGAAVEVDELDEAAAAGAALGYESNEIPSDSTGRHSHHRAITHLADHDNHEVLAFLEVETLDCLVIC